MALIALALPPIVTNAYVGMSEVDDSVRDAAKGMGMKGRQSLLRAELPTAVPPVMNGIRIALLQVIATAGLAALVGAGGLGRYIIDGIAVQDTVRVFGGAILVAGLALGADGLLALAERAATPEASASQRSPVDDSERKHPVNQHLRKLAAVAVGVALVAAACGDDDDDSGSGATTTAASGAATTAAAAPPRRPRAAPRPPRAPAPPRRPAPPSSSSRSTSPAR